MKQKEVKIIGLSVNNQLGILHAVKLSFDKDKKTFIVKGGVGSGKTTLQKSLQVTTLGSKAFPDKMLYGEIDTEVQLLDGDINIWIGCKSTSDGNLSYTLYTKDKNGKKIKNPIIDGVKATPSKYLQSLQTELTWGLDDLMSENPTIHRNILLKLYKQEFVKLGVILDKKSPQYEGSILHQIDVAKEKRSEADMFRKQVGGIKEDLLSKGYDPERPATYPEYIDTEKIEREIQEQERLKTIAETTFYSDKENKLQKILTEVEKVKQQAYEYNSAIDKEYQLALSVYEKEKSEQDEINSLLQDLNNKILQLKEKGVIVTITHDYKERQLEKPKCSPHINFDDSKNIITTDNFEDQKAQQIINRIKNLRQEYSNISKNDIKIDLSGYDNTIEKLKKEKENALNTNKIFHAIKAWKKWKDADDEVQRLNKEYYSLLKEVNTGVEGLHIIPEDENLYLAYDGSYSPDYFKNPNKELRKLSSYSGTQQPMIALLIQSYLLGLKDKAMRYMFIDNIPIDTPTKDLLEDMAHKLNLTIFINITGDFTKDNLKDGEVLVAGGEIFFNN